MYSALLCRSMVWFEGVMLQGEQLGQGNPAIYGSHHLSILQLILRLEFEFESDFIRQVQERHCACLRGNTEIRESSLSPNGVNSV